MKKDKIKNQKVCQIYVREVKDGIEKWREVEEISLGSVVNPNPDVKEVRIEPHLDSHGKPIRRNPFFDD